MNLSDTIVNSLRSVLGEARVGLHEPWFIGHELDYVRECIDTGWVSSVGGFVDRFEADLAAYCGVAHAVVVSNGTVGLQVALESCGVGPGDEVFIPSLSFIATANSVRHAGAEPHFIDVDQETLGISPEKLSNRLQEIAERRETRLVNRHTGRRLAAVIPMHTFGHPVNLPRIIDICKEYGLTVIEDAAESLGSFLGGHHTGSFGRCGVLSFNGNKIVTTGGGGAIITNDRELAKKVKHITTTAKLPHKWAFIHDEVGYNFRMPNLNAALGCAQLEQLEKFITAKRQLTDLYVQAFAAVPNVSVFKERPGVRSNYWLQTLILDPEVADQRDEILAATNDAGLMTRPVWEPLSHLPMYRKSPQGPLDQTEDLARRIINIPSSPQLCATGTKA